MNPSMGYFIPIWWRSVSKIVQKHFVGQGFHTAATIERQWATRLFVWGSNSN